MRTLLIHAGCGHACLQCGTVVVQYVHGHAETYAVLFILILFHLATNVMAVRVISMRSFNRQRASIAWQEYRASLEGNLAAPSRNHPF